ncbi:MAG: anthranilate phosphoribosyltransferase [Gammaproteobacteria bacterium]|nr:anthranilate phosphoribosyltransferase [Gammaproteobacteria bacterium]
MEKMINLKKMSQTAMSQMFADFINYSVEKQSAILTCLRVKKEATADVLGALKYFKGHCVTVPNDMTVIDLVGTGGDGKGTFNISTAASLLAASSGALVAKHGGRSASGMVGSQDVADALGMKYEGEVDDAMPYLKKNGYIYLPATLFNPVFKQFSQLRRNLGFPTLFNLIGPLLNPMQPKRMVLGVYRKDLLKTMAQVLRRLNYEHAMVVYAGDGLDEFSLAQKNYVIELKGHDMMAYTINANDVGLSCANIASVKGGDVFENASIIVGILSGKITGPKRDIALFNAAAGLYVAGVVSDLKSGVALTQASIESGAALQLLSQLGGQL